MTGRPYIVFLVLLVSLLLSWAFWGLGGSLADEEAITTEGYLSRIHEAMTHLESREGELGPQEVEWLKERFPEGLEVRDAEGHEVQVDRTPLSRWLEGEQETPEGRKWLLDHLNALHAYLSMERDPSLSGASMWEERRALLDEIYRAGEFRHLKERQPPFWWAHLQRFLEALERWLQRNLPRLGGIEGSWVQAIAYGVVLLMGVILILWVVRSFGFTGWSRRSPVLSDKPPSSPVQRDWASWRQEADQKAQERAFREAIRCLFVSVLLKGHQQGWWTYEPHATNREHLGSLERGSRRQEVFRRLMDVYEWAWYGFGQPNEEKYRTCLEWVQRLEEAK